MKFRGTDDKQNDAKKINYVSFHGTRMGELVAANSKLAKEFRHHCFIKSTNF